VRIYAFYTFSNRARSSSVVASVSGLGSSGSQTHVFSELTFPPFGFELSFGDCKPLRPDFYDMSRFSQFDYRDARDIVMMKMPVMPIYSMFPGDYRTRDQMMRDRAENDRLAQLVG
jgi:hypothetical protein